jgi:predicted nucleic acid-binding Zn ribbon protein
MNEQPRVRCAQCGSRRTHRLIGPGGGLVFKGSGFHETDYRGPKYAADKRRDEESK